MSADLNLRNNMKKFAIFILVILLSGCTNYSTDLNEMQKIKVDSMDDIKKGESCTNNLFGAFTLPYVGDTAIKLSGDQSVIAAIKKAGIQDIYAVDRRTKNYFLIYSKRCTIVFGK